MELAEARQQVIDAGKRLLHTGLIARTWGNVSCRLNDNQFVITPSGRSYEDLTPQEIVIVNISDGRSWGDILPSSEKGVHLEAYRLRPDINFIIHTHQLEASVMSALDRDLEAAPGGVFGDTVFCAEYGFPGSEELKNNMGDVIAKGDSRALLMAHHGALCLGGTMEEAFRVAVSLELLSSHQIKMAFEEKLDRPMTMEDSLYDIILNQLGVEIPEEGCPLFYSRRCEDGFEFFCNNEQRLVSFDAETDDFAETVHRKIYMARPDINYITQFTNPSMLAYSVLGREIETYIDDFAQINGPVMGYSDLDADSIVAALGDNHGVQVKASGVLCCGRTIGDVDALAMVAEKNARAWLISQLFPDEIRAIPREECDKMRNFYLQSYSKRF
ncbi:MAG: class II aldolase/adducin family protein [Bacillota bacterium]|nr:class II aldolase/adducin family protein [Bacillota bacterium]